MKYKSEIKFHDFDIPMPVFFIHFKNVLCYFYRLFRPKFETPL